MNSDLTAGKS